MEGKDPGFPLQYKPGSLLPHKVIEMNISRYL